MSRTVDRLREWATDSALNLAIFRIVLHATILLSHSITASSRAAVLVPFGLRTPPYGLAHVFERMPISEDLGTLSYYTLLAAAITGLFGLASRVSSALVAIAALYLWGIGESMGHVFHFHHLVWFAALLGASPCGDVLSIDSLLYRRRRQAPLGGLPSAAYGVPLRAAVLLIGFIFFFPGLWKLLESGTDWFWSDNLRNQMYAKWYETPTFTPLFRIDHYPDLLRLCALAVVAMELGFPLLVVFRRTRLFAVTAAMGFHLSTAALMDLHFPALFSCYVVLIDWTTFFAWIGKRMPGFPLARRHGDRRRSLLASALVSLILLTGNGIFGALGISDGWPFACYPKFHRIVTARLPDLRVEIVDPSGRIIAVADEAMFPTGRTQRAWALVWSVIGSHERAQASAAKFQAFWKTISRRDAVAKLARGATAVRFYRVTVSTIPEERNRPPLTKTFLYELVLKVPTGDNRGRVNPLPNAWRGCCSWRVRCRALAVYGVYRPPVST